ncbi:MAG: ATP-binding protein [Deltaproteobacteria bacterium]|nr:ATP-binding protein [Deltaproteobacteria bacterium]
MSLISEYSRLLSIDIPINPLTGSGAAFLWGARGTGKTTLLRQKFPQAKYYDLLKSDLFTELTLEPHRLREEILARKPKLIILDEIQKIPRLLDEVHWLLENTATLFILCGSSARKLKREAKNLLGGRAVSFYLFPLVTREIPHFQLERALQSGLVPRHYLSEKPRPLLKAYTQNYLKEEIIEEAIVRNIPSFARFLNTVALTHGQLLNYANIAREVGVSPGTVRDYYQILEDTLLGHTLEPWRKQKDRRLIETAKFYLFDVGVANSLNPEIEQVVPGTDIFGNAFEHFLIEEVKACLSYREKDDPLTFWRTASGYEVDLIIGNLKAALEFKAAIKVSSRHLKGMRALKEEQTPKRCLLVSREPGYRKTEDGIELMHWKDFCRKLWEGQIV